ncbi:hypothetical protein [Mesonia maritima]|uniref:Uncharacterized protein n=1 Tax=Mesonia maritima TaxID=1793873 RepID=A0ABU1K1L0_9FLAO|nr:hypothetical protein [Mesonia maritima]MDR6299495.1 hypothetical protein [Mesonia maritima]
MKVFKIFEYAYLVVAAFFAVEAYRIWDESQGRAYIFMAFVAVAIFMFFFKRRFRKKMEQNNQE